ncbi:MAG: Na+/H+ antiporter [Betaproteobacteria bacterium]
MEPTAIVLISLLAVLMSAFVARVSGIPLPLVQITLGAAIHFSGLPTAVLDPQVFFLLFLPPLLFLDGWRIPKNELFREAPTILKLALGLVLFTVIGMGVFIHWLIPTIPLAVAFALAAVISPTDPVAVTAIAARTPIPGRLRHIIQGEALLNDATGLVCMRFAVAAAMTGTFSLAGAMTSFLWVALGGLAIGIGVTWVVARFTSWATAQFGEDAGTQILMTVLIPFGVYLLAERLHCSGILAAVAAGVTMSFMDIWQWRAATRLRRTAFWDMVQLAANGSIFVLLGEQIPALLSAAQDTMRSTPHFATWWLGVYVVSIVAALGAIRFAWVWISLKVTFFRARRRGIETPVTSLRLVMAATLAGVRGAVTLAGVLTLPLVLHDGTAFPARDLAIFLAAGVIVVSLLLTTLALPRTLRGLEQPTDEAMLVEEDRARLIAAETAASAIEVARNMMISQHADANYHMDAAASVVDLYRKRIDRLTNNEVSARGANSDDIERELRLVGLRAEREAFLKVGRDRGLDDLTLRKILRELDLLEARYGG